MLKKDKARVYKENHLLKVSKNRDKNQIQEQQSSLILNRGRNAA